MYIEDRLFSETTEEVLYSVLMDEEEISLYSEFQKEFASIRDVKKAAKIMGEGTAKGGFTKGQIRSMVAYGRRLNKHGKKLVENDAVFDKVSKAATNSALKGARIKDPDVIKAAKEATVISKKQAKEGLDAFIARSGKGLPGEIKNLPRR